tara:strand:- start:6857 stop:7924 length:1068 start_codon:yes stop_codon:yes gene_type:complete
MLFQKNLIKKEKFIKIKIPNNFKIINIYDEIDLFNFCKDKDVVAINEIGKDPRFFKIYYLLKKYSIKQILITNFGHFGRSTGLSLKFKNWYKPSHLFHKGSYYIFRILTILNIFPKIEILFESDKKIIKAIKNGISAKLENLFSFIKIIYFKKTVLINSRSFYHYKKYRKRICNKSTIVYGDTPFFSRDRISVEYGVSRIKEKNYYKNLNFFLKNLSNLLNYKVVICTKPGYSYKNKFSRNFKISTKRTVEEIPSCGLFVFSASSTVLEAVVFGKKIINIKSNYLGNFINNHGNQYSKKLGISSINIDENFRLKKKDIKFNTIKYKKFIREKLITDKNNDPNKKIIDIVKKNFKF